MAVDKDHDKRDAEGNLLPDEQCQTNADKFVQSMRFDESTQFKNVLKCNMALISPKPFLIQYMPLYFRERARRREVS